MPLYAWLKSYFRDNKQMGSRDRRLLSTLVYGFYRLGHAVKGLSVEDRMLAGLFLCNDQPAEFLQYFRPEYDEKATLPLGEKISFFQTQPAGAGFRVTDIFPWKEELSAGIDHEAFCLSFLRQPDLFLRIRPGRGQEVLDRLNHIFSSGQAQPVTAQSGPALPTTSRPGPPVQSVPPAQPAASSPYEFIPP